MPQKERASLTRLTLRELRLEAKNLNIPLYGRKSKDALIKEIVLLQERQEDLVEGALDSKFQREEDEIEGVDLDSTAYSETSPGETRVVFLPRDPEWAYVFWEISENDKQEAQSHGANRLSLRLSDVNQNNQKLSAGTLREITVDSHSTEWYLPIPIGDRDYRVELGYRCGSKWVSLATSSVARVPSLHPSDQILDQFVPFSLDANPVTLASENPDLIENQGIDVGVHERLYQSATTTFRKTRIGSEEFHERDLRGQSNVQNTDSGSGLWASGLNESGVGGVHPRNRPFWLIADAELIVYGATDPSAKLTIGGEQIALGADGTFKLQVPFPNGSQEYVIEAFDSNSDQARNITMRFERETPKDNTNTIDESKSEWF